MNKKLMTNSLRETLWGWLFVSLWVVGFLVFTCYPLLRTFGLSFNQVTITAEGIVTEHVGGANYKNALLSDVVFTDALINFVGELILDVPIVIVFSLVMAMILNMGLKGTGLLRTVFFLPVIIMSGPVMKKLIENGATTIQGAAESALVQNVLGMLPEQLASILNNLLSSFIMILWFCGVQILIFLSALQKVDKPVYEAAKIDGASKWAQFWKITLPTLRPMIIVNMLYTIVSISSFELNEVIVLIQKDSFAANYGLGYASALSFLYFIVLMLIMVMFVGIYGLRSPTDRKIAKEARQMIKQVEKIQRAQTKRAR